MRALTANTAAEVTASVTRPLYLVELGLATTLRFSTREQVTWRGLTWSAAGLRVDLSGRKLSLLNETLSYTDDFLAGVSGKPVTIWLLYGDAPFGDTDAEEVFVGEIGAVGIGERIEIRLRPAPARRLPRLYVTPPTFNHLPPDGLQILTPSGVFRLERK